jgi:F0F1-type ATP synthase epsilon subunit
VNVSGSPTTRLRLLGILFWMAGGIVITFGWMGMAELAYVDGQMPYLISGGIAGLALILVGSTLIVAAAVAEAAERTAQRTAELLKQAADEAMEAAAADRDATAKPAEAETRPAEKAEVSAE